jgi:hypothetical protein
MTPAARTRRTVAPHPAPGDALSRYLALAAAVALIAPTPAAHAQGAPVTTVNVNGTPVHPAQYGYIYNSSLTAGDVRLQDGSRGELWMFEGLAGECAAIIMNSTEFDAYLVLRAGAPFGESVAEDDDSGGGTDALIRVRLPRTGTYLVTATTFGEGQALGRYSLDVDRC